MTSHQEATDRRPIDPYNLAWEREDHLGPQARRIRARRRHRAARKNRKRTP